MRERLCSLSVWRKAVAQGVAWQRPRKRVT